MGGWAEGAGVRVCLSCRLPCFVLDSGDGMYVCQGGMGIVFNIETSGGGAAWRNQTAVPADWLCDPISKGIDALVFHRLHPIDR